MKIKVLLTDLDDTLINTRPAYQNVMQKCYKLFVHTTKSDITFEDFLSANKEAQKTYETSQIPVLAHHRFLRFSFIIRKFVKKMNTDLAIKLTDLFYNDAFSKIKPFNDTYKVLSQLKGMPIKIVIITDGLIFNKMFKLGDSGFVNLIDEFVVSEEIGFDKPNPQIFLEALKRAGEKPENAIMLGNDASRDIKGAKLLGIKTIHFNKFRYPEDQPKNEAETADFEITNISDVIRIIEAI